MVLAALADLVLPVRCLGCGVDGAAVCVACARWDGPRRVRPGGLDIVAATRYDGVVRQVLLHHKERGRRDLAGVLGRALAAAVRTVLADHGVATGAVVLVPVPSSAAARRSRGGDHLARPVAVASRRSRVPVARSVLHHTRAVRDSAGLGAAERSGNLDHALAARPPGRGHRGSALPSTAPGTASLSAGPGSASPGAAPGALLVDDIVTTGATLLEAQRALEASGWWVLGAAVVAATARHRDGREGTADRPGGVRGRAAPASRSEPTGRPQSPGLASC